MKNQLDIKSMAIGFLSAALLIMAFSFKNSNSMNGGNYQTSIGEKGIIILNTENGAYIITTDAAHSDWRRGDFKNTYNVSKDIIEGK